MMKARCPAGGVSSLLVAVGLLSAAVVQAQTQPSSLEERVKQLEKQLADVQQQAGAEARAKQRFHLAGYAHAGFEAGDESDESFTAGAFTPVFHYQYKDAILAEGELEFAVDEDGETETEVEYASLNWFAHDYLAFRIGKWLSPIGQFQERMHPAWINKLPNAPAGFSHDGALPLSDVGVQLRGGVPVSGDILFTYTLAVGNGPRLEHHGLELEGFGRDDNNDKSLGGRFGLLPFPAFEIGISFLTAEATGVEADSGPVSDGDYTLWGADFAYTLGLWDIRGEYFSSELESFFGQAEDGDSSTSRIPKTEWEAWYLQAAYKLSGLSPQSILSNIELVGRYGEFDTDGYAEFEEAGADETRVTAGINYLLTPSAIVKLAVEDRNFRNTDRKDDERLLFQFAYGF